MAAGAGLTLVPRLALEVEGRGDLGLNFVPFPKPEPFRTISLAYRRASARASEFRLLAEHLVRGVPAVDRRLRRKR